MRILYDHQAFSLQNTGGITRYFYELVKNFSSREAIYPEVHLGFSGTTWPIEEASKPSGKVIRWGKHNVSPGMPTYALNELLLNLRAIGNGTVDIYHNTLYRFMPAVRSRRFVATHHDCVQERYSELFPDRRRIMAAKRRMFQQADLVLCVSESSRVDLEHFYGVEPGRCQVIYNGITPMNRTEAGRIELSQKTTRPFLLYVGIRASYKNFNGFLAACAQAGIRSTHDILVIGGGPFSSDEAQLIQEQGLQDVVIPIPFASQDLLSEAYASASLLVYPSFYEGFGFPPLEAMLMGTVALVAASPATLEVCGDAAIFFNPLDPADFVDQLKTSLQNEEIRKEKIAKGLEQAKKYRWDKTSEQVLAAYRTLL